MSEPISTCLECGTCCFSELEAYVRVLGTDYSRLGERAAALTHFIGNRCYMKMVEGHCAALEVQPSSGRFVCSAYEQRPDVCRALERASPQCSAEIHEKGNRPRALLVLLRSTR